MACGEAVIDKSLGRRRLGPSDWACWEDSESCAVASYRVAVGNGEIEKETEYVKQWGASVGSKDVSKQRSGQEQKPVRLWRKAKQML